MLLAGVVLFMMISIISYLLIYMFREGTSVKHNCLGLFGKCSLNYDFLLVNLLRWVFILLPFACWIPAVYYFSFVGSTNKSKEPYLSRNINKPCLLSDFYDSHDMWHLLGAFGLMGMVLLLTHLHKPV